MHDNESLSIETKLLHWAEETRYERAVVPPIFQNSLFLYDTMDEFMEKGSSSVFSPGHIYSRISNPTVDIAERKIAMLEGTSRCKLFGSGTAAISAAIMSHSHQGSHIVMVDTAYGPSKRIASEYLSRFGVEATFVEGTNTDEVLNAIQPNTTMVYLETPSSILFRIQDLPVIAAECKRRGITTAIDNTYCTPLFMRPKDHGIDIVIHSGSKFFGGHSDINAGVVCTDDERMEKIIRGELDLFGSILHPFSAWLLLRGLRTLEVRVERHSTNAQKVAEWLEQRPEVEQVLHLGLPSFPQYDRVQKLMKKAGGLFTFIPKSNDPAKVKAFVDSLQIFGRGVSWGGFESLALCMPMQPMDWDETRWVVRLFCGLESPDDLIADLTQALQKLQ